MFVINATNLHVGGCVQVAVSFITELNLLIEAGELDGKQYSIFASSKVMDNLENRIDKKLYMGFYTEDVNGFSRPRAKTLNYFKDSKVVFTIFGPCYYNMGNAFHICGFAQPWILYPDNEISQKMSVIKRLFFKVKYRLQSYFFRKSDLLVVEALHVKQVLENSGYKNMIHVVSNCSSNVFDTLDFNYKFNLDNKLNEKCLTFGFLGRGYEHKNLRILKDVNKILLQRYGANVNFVFTLTEAEMQSHGFSDISNFYSLGEITVNDCPAFYNSIDATIFPSLLECFSATPIESIKMQTPILASDRHFITDFSKDAGLYFDPLDALSIASTVNDFLSSEDLRQKLKFNCQKLSENMDSTPAKRAKQYVELIKNTGL